MIDVDDFAAQYRETRRPSPQRRRAIAAGVKAAIVEEDRAQRRRHLWGVALAVAAAAVAAVLIDRALDSRDVERAHGTDPSVAPYGATEGGVHGEAERRETKERASAAPKPAEAPPVDEVAPTVPAPTPATEPPRSPTKTATPMSRPTKRAPAPTESKAANDLDSMRLLRQAEKALERDPARSLQLLQRHAREFAESPLTLEREALTVIALCRSGRMDAGRRRQRAFLAAHGGSAYATRVRKACRE